MKNILFLFIILLIFSCNKEQKDLTVKTNIVGLKKGTVYLKKAQDSTLIIVDSLVINGNSSFELYSDIETPEMYFLYLDKNSKDDDRIAFFADKGITEINTTVKNFVFDAKISGSNQQKILEEYKFIKSRLNNINLDIIKANFDAQISKDSIKRDSLEQASKNLLRRKYLYTINFAINNKDSEVAPYLALTEVYDTNIKYLESIYSSLIPKVKGSKYGKELKSFINEIRKERNE